MPERIRIDKWLWQARFYRSRPLAQQAAFSGLIRLNGHRVVKARAGVCLGDVLTLPHGREVVAVRVAALGTRRGPASEARTLYEIVAGAPLDHASTPP